jgi:hypothetical protein
MEKCLLPQPLLSFLSSLSGVLPRLYFCFANRGCCDVRWDLILRRHLGYFTNGETSGTRNLVRVITNERTSPSDESVSVPRNASLPIFRFTLYCIII